MAYELRTGDTWPPLTVTLTESTTSTDPKRYPDSTGQPIRRVDLATAPPSSIRAVMKQTGAPLTVIEGVAVNVEVVDGAGTNGAVTNQEPGNGVPANRGQVRYPWQTGDTDVPGSYKGEIEVTWNSAATPPSIETFPNDDANNFDLIISADLD